MSQKEANEVNKAFRTVVIVAAAALGIAALIYNPARPIPQWQKDMAGWVNKKMLFEKIHFWDFEPRKGFKCKEYFV